MPSVPPLPVGQTRRRASSSLAPVLASEEAVSLAKAAAAGDRAAQRRIFLSLRRPVHATVYRVLGSNQQSEDVVQDAFIEIFRSLHNYQGKAKLTTWADRVTVRVVYRHLRGRHPVPTEEVDVPGSAREDEQRSVARQGVNRLYTLLQNMKHEQRVAFTLFEVDGRSLREVADAMGVNLVAAKSRVWRARRWVQAQAEADPVLKTVLEHLREAA